MKPKLVNAQSMPLKIVGSNKFGQYAKISDEQTWNMYESDGWLVPYPGFAMRAYLSFQSIGRTNYTSEEWGNMMVIVGNAVYGVPKPVYNTANLEPFFIGFIETYTGDVFIAENTAGQIAICDGQQIYIYNYKTPTNPALQLATLPIDTQTSESIVPGYITYQNGKFLTINEVTAAWFYSNINNGLNWVNAATSLPFQGEIQGKPTNSVAVLSAPGRGNLLYVFGRNITEMWIDTGNPLFTYQKSQSVNIDYGCLSPATIAAMDKYVVWLGINERSGPVIMVSTGSDAIEVSTDGIDFKLGDVNNPSASVGFLFKQDGHVFYHLTFYDLSDNFTLVYDFHKKVFYYASDENRNYFPAAHMAYFNDTYYFVSLNDGNIYEFNSYLTQYDYTVPNSGNLNQFVIPRVRITPPMRFPDMHRFVINSATLPIEQGNDPYFPGYTYSFLSTEAASILTTEDVRYLTTEVTAQPYHPRVDLALSKDGASSFGSFFSKPLNPQGMRRNRFINWQLGSANEVSFYYRFLSKSRILVSDGEITIR
jgi:hypothetical protein